MKRDFGPKEKAGKLPLNLVEPCLIRAAARAMQYGQEKYKPEDAFPNGCPSMADLYAALQRHLNDFRDGEACASDSGLHHLDHAAANLMMMIWRRDKHKENNW